MRSKLPCAPMLPLLLAISLLTSARAAEPALVEFDFKQESTAKEWRPLHDLTGFQHTPEGLAMDLTGEDPYFAGPARDYPAGTPLRLRLRLKSEQGGGGQLFFFRDRTTEEQSVRFQVFPGDSREVQVRLPALGPGYSFRIDPPGKDGRFVIASLRVTADVPWAPPAWPKPEPPAADERVARLESGALTLVHHSDALGAFAIEVQGRRMASSHNRPLIGCLVNDQPRWIAIQEMADRQFKLSSSSDTLRASTTFTDPDGVRWQIEQQFTRKPDSETIDVLARTTVDHDRAIIFLPQFTLLPGAGSFGEEKGQGLFAGLEYLDDEPSSSEADVKGAAAKRLVPDSLKITFPLMAIQADHRYVGLTWEMQTQVCALFDSPDRTFQGGGHAMGLVFPGSNGVDREDGNLLPQDAVLLHAHQPLEIRATILGGLGESVVPAIQKYVGLRRLPPLPKTLDLPGYVRLTAAGWLDSKIREGDSFLHAVWQNWRGRPAADAAFYLDWLAIHAPDATLSARLTATARAALGQVELDSSYSSSVGHVHFPAAPLIHGRVLQNSSHARDAAKSLLRRFEPDGRVLYRAAPSQTDYGKTHVAPDANGLTAQVVISLLDAATFSGDRALIDEALRRLRGLDKFRHTVPRGAQTWEVPLHTPDILACAHLVRAYVVGYELTGDMDLLDQARSWAWTGLPFIYLRNPTDHPIGAYLTPPVYGATGWVAPVWMGLPVQWCGLVYADALYRLVRHDPKGPWQQLADGITIGGIQITWPFTDAARQGLLPDVFYLREQFRDGPAINPGTVQACAARYYTRRPLYDFRVVREAGLLIHAPGEISTPRLETGRVKFTVSAWPQQPCFVLVNGLTKKPVVRINDQETALQSSEQYQDGRAVLQVAKTARIELELR